LHKTPKKVYLFVASCALIFSTMEIALKFAGTTMDPFQITFLRFIIGGIALVPFAVHESKNKPKGFLTGKLLLFLVCLGAVIVPFCMILFQIGVMRSNAATSAVIFCSNPIFTMLAAHFLTKDDKMTRNKLIALILGAIGLVFMIRPWDIQEGNTLSGALLSLLAAAIFGIYGVVGGKTIKRVGVFTQTSLTFIFGALILLCIMPPLGRPILTGLEGELGILIYVSLVVTCGGYLTYFMAMKYSNATTASVTFFLKPVIAPILAVLIVGETITYNMYIGIALILAASYIMTFRKQVPTAVEKENLDA
jgi:Permeases of the drug/metabolite transporter (DMT) superfamily